MDHRIEDAIRHLINLVVYGSLVGFAAFVLVAAYLSIPQ